MYDYLISCISWEERFKKGIEFDLEKHASNKKEFMIFNTYEKEKSANLQFAMGLDNAEITQIDFSDALSIWKTLREKFYSDRYLNKKVLIDISTMPRETIWLTLMFLSEKTMLIDFIYHKPEDYGTGLLSYNPLRPRLIYKMSGVSDSDKPTMLIVTAGFDFERIDAIKNKFEPAKLLILYHFNEKYRDSSLFDDLKKKYPTDSLVRVDAYNTQELYLILKSILQEQNSNAEYNVVCASLGPKPTAISFYQLWREFPNIALSYTPSKDYNMGYSWGISDSVFGPV